MPSKRKQQRLPDALADLSSAEEDEPVLIKPSGFAALLPQEDDPEPESDNNDVETPSQLVQGPSSPTKPAVAKKKKRKPKKLSVKDEQRPDELDEVDQALRELGLAQVGNSDANHASSATSAANETSAIHQMRALVDVEVRNLDPHAELRRMFGSKVINASRATMPNSGQGKQSRKYRIPALKHPSQFSKAAADWPPINLVKFGASMEVDKEASSFGPSEELWFTVLHNRSYKELQMNFLEATASHDPNSFYALLAIQPYHVDTLLALADVALMQGDAGRADDFQERVLYAYEYAASAGFSLNNSSARLNFNRVENRALFRTLDRKVTSLIKRGCYATAFETAKVLLQLDPWSDPYGSLLHFEFLAPKARQGKWFLDFCQQYKALFERLDLEGALERPQLENYPGIAFSRALCMFDLEEDEASEKAETKHEESTKLLRETILTFPYAAHRLAVKLGVTIPEPFKKSKRAQYKDSWQSKRPDMMLHLLSALYVERVHVLWKPPELLAWLQSTIASCGDLIESSLHEASQRGRELEKGNGLTPLSKDEPLEMPLSLLRHIVAADVASVRPMLPPGTLSRIGDSFDPLKPPRAASYDDDYFRGILPTNNTTTRANRSNPNNALPLMQALCQAGQNFDQMDDREREMLMEQIAQMTEEQEGEDPEERGVLREALGRFMQNFWPGAGR